MTTEYDKRIAQLAKEDAEQTARFLQRVFQYGHIQWYDKYGRLQRSRELLLRGSK